MEDQDNLRTNIDVNLILIELKEIRNQINHVHGIHNDNVPEYRKKFLLEDLKQYENYLKKKLALAKNNTDFRRN